MSYSSASLNIVDDDCMLRHATELGSSTSATMKAELPTAASELSLEAVVSLFQCWSSEASLLREDIIQPVFVDQDDDSWFLPSVHDCHPVANEGIVPNSELCSHGGVQLLPRIVQHPLELLSSQDLLHRLQKRLRSEDIPSVPILKRRKRPNCTFLNYMGKTRMKDYQQQHGVNALVHLAKPSLPDPAVSGDVPEFSVDSIEYGLSRPSGLAYLDMGLDWVIEGAVDEEDRDDSFRTSLHVIHFCTKAKFADPLLCLDDDNANSTTDNATITFTPVAAALELELGDAPLIVLGETEQKKKQCISLLPLNAQQDLIRRF